MESIPYFLFAFTFCVLRCMLWVVLVPAWIVYCIVVTAIDGYRPQPWTDSLSKGGAERLPLEERGRPEDTDDTANEQNPKL